MTFSPLCTLRRLAAASVLLAPLSFAQAPAAGPAPSSDAPPGAVAEAARAPASRAAAAGPNPCAEFVRWLPNVSTARCRAAQLQPGPGRSVLGRTIFVRDVVVDHPRLKVLVLGAIHGDEMSSASLVLHWAGLAGADAAGVSWRFIPALNPDGLFKRPAQRANAHGIDLNRNFPTPDWARQTRIYWEQRTRKDPRRYPGPSPLSEPETRFLRDEMDGFAPNLIVSVHAPYGVLDFDGPQVEPPRQLGSLLLDQVGIYPGSLGNYGGVQRGMPVVTIELPSAEATPRDAEMQQMWADLLKWMGEHLQPIAPSIAPPVVPPVPVPAAPASTPVPAALPPASATPPASAPTLPEQPATPASSAQQPEAPQTAASAAQAEPAAAPASAGSLQ